MAQQVCVVLSTAEREQLAAIAADRIRCYEYSVDDEFAREVAPLRRSGEKWLPGS